MDEERKAVKELLSEADYQTLVSFIDMVLNKVVLLEIKVRELEKQVNNGKTSNV